MLLKIREFRYCIEKDIQFNNEIYSLSGRSGSGKSTIFESIYWCLYGTLTKPYPPGKQHAKTKVTIICDDYKIKRKRKPNSLLVTMNNNEYRNEFGQAIINDIYGDNNRWLITSYIRQGKSHHWFNLSSKDKMSFLNSIVFREADPRNFIQKVKLEIRDNETEHQLLTSNYDNNKQHYDEIISTFDINFDDILTDNEVDELELSINEKNQLIANLQTTKHNLHQLHTKHITLIENVELLEDDLSHIPIYDLSYVKNLIKENEEHKEYNFYLNKLTAKVNQLNTYSHDHSIEFTDHDYRKAILQDRNYRSNILICESLNIEYCEDIINDKIIEITEMKQMIEFDCMNKRYLSIQQQVDNICDNINSTNEENITTIKETIYLLELSRAVLECPHCHNELQFDNNSLVKSELKIFNQSLWDEQHILLEEQKSRQRMINIRDNLIEKLNNLEYHDIPDIEFIQYDRSIIDKLSSIVIIDKPVYDPDYIKQSLDYFNIKNDIEILESKLSQFKIIELTQDHFDVKEMNKCIIKHKQLSKQIAGLYVKIDHVHNEYLNIKNNDFIHDETISRIDESIDLHINDIDQYNNNISASRENKYIKRLDDGLLTTMDKISQIDNKLEKLEKLKNYSETLESDILCNLTNEITNYINILSPRIFIDPIVVNLSVLKKNKSGKDKNIIKNKINLVVIQNGVEHTINELSGGQQDRLSLLLLLSFNMVLGSKMLILDETLKYLNYDSRVKSNNLVSSNCDGMITMIVDHLPSSGTYDHVIDI